MKIRLLLLSLALIAFSAVRAEEPKPVAQADAAAAQAEKPALVAAQADKPALVAAQADKPAPVAKPEKPETELEKTMAKINKPWRQIRTAARDGKLTSDMAGMVEAMKVNAEAALKLTPELEADQPSPERAKFHAAYQAQMKKLIAAFGELEAALKANDLPAATKLVADIGDIRKSGHKDFKKPDEK